MKMFKKIKFKYLSLVLMASGLVVYGNNCARLAAPADETILSSNENGGSGSQNTKLSGESLSLMTGDQLFNSMIKLTRLPNTAVSEATRTEFRTRFQSFAGKSKTEEITPPLMLSAVSLAGQVCNDLIVLEALPANTNNRRFFSNINFNAGTTAISNDAFARVVKNMAQLIWDRAETSEELQSFIDFRTEFEADLTANERAAVKSTRDLMLATCSSVLSAADVVTF